MTFATERDVRNEAFLQDFDEVPSGKLVKSLDKAHEDILRETTWTDESTVSDDVVRAEAILAISHLFRSIAVSSAVSAQDWKATGLHIAGHSRVHNLMELADRIWDEAWRIFRPYLKHASPPSLSLINGGES